MLLEDSISKNKDLPCHNYDFSELDKLCDKECLVEFQFLKNYVYQLAKTLGLPEDMKCYNGLKVDGKEFLCIYLKHFVYSCRYSYNIAQFG